MTTKEKYYWVLYVEDSCPKAKRYKVKAAADRFVKAFLKKGSASDGYWVDFVFYGEALFMDPYYSAELEKK